ncbi:MAG: hypothetical protein N3B21_19360 [Clostridia bacterium]|nr:hypothetical protein [Clostridia bacterium]
MALTDLKLTFNLRGPEGNIFAILSKTVNALTLHGKAIEAREMQTRVFNSLNYEEAKRIIAEYVEVTYID